MALGVQSWQVMGDIASRVDQKLGGLPEAQRGVGDLERHRKEWRKGIQSDTTASEQRGSTLVRYQEQYNLTKNKLMTLPKGKQFSA